MIDSMAKDKIIQWKNDPIAFFIEALGIDPDMIWYKMREIAEAVRDNKRVAVKAGHSVSKTYSMARIALWYLYTHYPSTIITTAPTHSQVEQILWREIREAKNNSIFKLPGKLTTTKLELEDRWFAFGFSTKPDQGQENATKMQGFHNEHLMVIFDEACGIIKPIWEAKEALLTSEKTKFVAIGNPTMATGEFVDCFKSSMYKKLTISVLDTPNYQHRREIIPGLSGRDFEEAIIEKYGKESNQYKCRILGEIPDGDADALIPISWIEKAENSGFVDIHNFEKRFITWDVADGGHDLHVIKAWRNTTEIDEIVLREKTIEEAEPYVWRLLRKIKGNTIIVDADGVGRIAVGLLEQTADEKTEIIAYEGSSHECSSEYRNKRAEAHWTMRCMFEKGELSISRNDMQREELVNLKLIDNPKGLIQMEKKKDMRQRIGRSPDYSDAIVMMCSEFEDVGIIKKKKKKYAYSYDPSCSDDYAYDSCSMAV